jgi:hypothetical protein
MSGYIVTRRDGQMDSYRGTMSQEEIDELRAYGCEVVPSDVYYAREEARLAAKPSPFPSSPEKAGYIIEWNNDGGTYCELTPGEVVHYQLCGYEVTPSKVWYQQHNGTKQQESPPVSGITDVARLYRRAEWAFRKGLNPLDLLEENAFAGMRLDELLLTLSEVAEGGSIDDCISAVQQVTALPGCKTPEMEQALAKVRARFMQLI